MLLNVTLPRIPRLPKKAYVALHLQVLLPAFRCYFLVYSSAPEGSFSVNQRPVSVSALPEAVYLTFQHLNILFCYTSYILYLRHLFKVLYTCLIYLEPGKRLQS
jgi:hypothetical protein